MIIMPKKDDGGQSDVNTLLAPLKELGEYEAIGPVLQGLNAPINDLSRGCNAQEVYKMALVTAALS